MRIGSLFSGAGGLDMAVEAVFGGETVWHAEIDKAASKVLAHRYPGIPNLGDITQVDWAHVPTVDILSLGFPCQDVSAAGKRAGIKQGTRSGLWSVAADAIEALQPRIVVVENVRGLLSATAHRMEPDATALGNGAGRPVLRAAGAVLGDLADLGYDAQWATVAAADVGAPHRRERVFIVAVSDTERIGRAGTERASISSSAPAISGRPSGATATDAVRAAVGFNTGRTSRAEAGAYPGDRPGDHRGERADVALLPTPRNTDGERGPSAEVGGYRPSGQSRQKDLNTVTVRELGVERGLEPVDVSVGEDDGAVSVFPGDGGGEDSVLIALNGEGVAVDVGGCVDGHNACLPVELAGTKPEPGVDLLPTPRSSDCFGAGQPGDGGMDLRTTITELAKENDAATEGRPGQGLRNLRDTTDPQAVCERTAGGPQRVPEADPLLPIVCEQPTGSASGQPPLEGAADQGEGSLRGLRDNGETPHSSQGQEPGEQRSVESRGAVQQLPQGAALAGGQGLHRGPDSGVSWGRYEAAIRRWENVLGRPAPNPTEPNKNGNPGLAAEFSSWLMGWPEGWVTDPAIGISRNDQLRIVGNGVCPQQAAAALRYLLEVTG
jgi:site-specific DNA-cytosine methylase